MRQRIQYLSQALNWTMLSEMNRIAVQQSLAIQQIPGPTFDEAARAAYICDQFASLSLVDTAVDSVFNAYGRLPGSDSTLPGLMVSAHSDTVFVADTDLSLRREDGLIYGPGLGDNCIGVGSMLALITALRDQAIQPSRDIWFVATSREEGLGDLDGMKAAYEKLATRIEAVINLEGLALGHVYHAGIAVRRLHITAQADGGHSWLHYGRPSAVHGILALGNQLLSVTLPRTPRTTLNIGMIEGGQGINIIATGAGLWLDLRSEDPAALVGVEAQVRALLDKLSTPDLRFSVEVVGDRPAGRIEPRHELVRAALAALDAVGVQGILETGSTDANIPLAAGCPAVTIGITRGGNAHRLDEYVELQPITTGLRQLMLLVLAVSGINNA